MNDDADEILATVTASPARRWMGVLTMYALAGLLFWIAFSQPPSVQWLVFLLVVGAGSLWLAERMRRATQRVITLTRTELRDSEGDVIAYVADVMRVDRGVFAFKPSNGFLIRTSTPAGPRAWQPGVWWRMGNQIGIGGMTPGRQTKPMSEILSFMIAERDMAAEQDNS